MEERERDRLEKEEFEQRLRERDEVSLSAACLTRVGVAGGWTGRLL